MTKKAEFENIKVDWAPILEPQISQLEEGFPWLAVRETFQNIIDGLNANSIKSRLILAGSEPAGYAYYLNSTSMSDRILGNAGFVDEKFANEERCMNLIQWLKDEGDSQGKIVMLNEIFKGGSASQTALDKLGFGKIERQMMEIYLRDVSETPVQVPEGYEITGLSNLNTEDYQAAQISAYQGSDDELLFSTKEEERSSTARDIFEGAYGEIMSGVSRIAMHQNSIAGVCIVTAGKEGAPEIGYPLIIDVFVGKEHRGRGIAKALMHEVLTRAKVSGLMKLYLWVNSNGNALKLYQSMGFKSSEAPHEIIYHSKI